MTTGGPCSVLAVMPSQPIHCPVCQKPMVKFQAPANVEIDACDAHGVWLDNHELDTLLKAANQPSEPGMFDGFGRTVVQSAAGGIGFSLANSLVRRIFG